VPSRVVVCASKKHTKASPQSVTLLQLRRVLIFHLLPLLLQPLLQVRVLEITAPACACGTEISRAHRLGSKLFISLHLFLSEFCKIYDSAQIAASAPTVLHAARIRLLLSPPQIGLRPQKLPDCGHLSSRSHAHQLPTLAFGCAANQSEVLSLTTARSSRQCWASPHRARQKFISTMASSCNCGFFKVDMAVKCG
jgi:hypothetical protein